MINENDIKRKNITAAKNRLLMMKTGDIYNQELRQLSNIEQRQFYLNKQSDICGMFAFMNKATSEFLILTRSAEARKMVVDSNMSKLKIQTTTKYNIDEYFA